MKYDQKDVVFCHQGSHAVPRSEISKLYSDDGKSQRTCCISCKEVALAMREKAKLAFREKAH